MTSEPADEVWFEPNLLFDTDESEFARGFNAGNIHGLLRECPDDHELVVFALAGNAEMLLRLAERHERMVITRDVDELHVEVAFSTVAQQPPAGRWER